MSEKQKVLRVYLDNCAYNRPYDDQTQMRINLETQAKLHIQELIRDGQIELVTSYVLDYENGQNRFEMQRTAIKQFMNENSSIHVTAENNADVKSKALEIMKTGVKEKDALHVACAKKADCDYFISTDDRLLKYQDDNMQLVTPEEFIRRMEAD
jgi:predicted nucleic acid-binding protein